MPLSSQVHMILRLIEKIIRELSRLRSTWYVSYLRAKGCKIGKGTKFHGRKNVDITRPHLIEIGDNVTITDDVIILTHAHDWSVLRNYYRDPMIIGSAGKVQIGNNVFIGTRAIITMGVTIGNNSIIAANSVVTRDVVPNTVVAGIPARQVRTLAEHYALRRERIVTECLSYSKELLRRKSEVSEEDFPEFFPLFKPRNETLSPTQLAQLADSVEAYSASEPLWNTLEAMLAEARAEK